MVPGVPLYLVLSDRFLPSHRQRAQVVMDKGRPPEGDSRMAQLWLHQVRYSPHPLPFILPSRLCCRVGAMRLRTPALTILLPLLLSLICRQRISITPTDDRHWPLHLVDPYSNLIRIRGPIRIKTHHGILRTNLRMHDIVVLNTMNTIAIHVATTSIHLHTTTTPTPRHMKLPTNARQTPQTIVTGRRAQADVRPTITRGDLGAVVAVDISPDTIIKVPLNHSQTLSHLGL